MSQAVEFFCTGGRAVTIAVAPGVSRCDICKQIKDRVVHVPMQIAFDPPLEWERLEDAWRRNPSFVTPGEVMSVADRAKLRQQQKLVAAPRAARGTIPRVRVVEWDPTRSTDSEVNMATLRLSRGTMDFGGGEPLMIRISLDATFAWFQHHLLNHEPFDQYIWGPDVFVGEPWYRPRFRCPFYPDNKQSSCSFDSIQEVSLHQLGFRDGDLVTITHSMGSGPGIHIKSNGP